MRFRILNSIMGFLAIAAFLDCPCVGHVYAEALSLPSSAGESLASHTLENLAFRADAVPIARVTSPTGQGAKDISVIKNGVTQESYDSYDGANVAGEDWYGYTWSEELYFDKLVFYEGAPSAAGGYWKSLTVQYTMDGVRWIEAEDAVITPAYDFSDGTARVPYSKYELSFTGCPGIGVRIYGRPGGPAFYASIAELEVYGTKPTVVCTRGLPTSYQSRQKIAVSLVLDVDAGSPSTLTIVEGISAGLTVSDAGGGNTSQPGQISWAFTGADVKDRTVTYSLDVPAAHGGIVHFAGTLTYPGVTDQNISGCQSVAPAPQPPSGLAVAFDVDAHLSWQPNPQEGMAGYHVYRSEDGGGSAEISGLIRDNTFADFFVEQGKSYQYKVTAENTTGAQSDLAVSLPSIAASPSMLRRQFEDYDFEGGNFPGGEGKRGFGASYRSDLLLSDLFYQDAPQSNEYRPDDPIAIPAFNPQERRLGNISPEDWWRYTFDVANEGYVKIGAIRAASDGQATLEFLWDESHQGWFSFNTGGSENWQVIPVSTPAFYSSFGQHTLRIILSAGSAQLDYWGIGFQQPQPSRVTLFSDDFESYNSTEDLTSSSGGWTIHNGSNVPEGAWQLWSTTGAPLGYESPDLPGMYGNYVISDGELAGPADLDEQLIGPQIDCTGFLKVTVQFGSNIQIYEPDVGIFDQVYDLDLATYDEDQQSWSDWNNVLHHEGNDGDNSSPKLVDVSALADGKKIKLRWRFWKANYDYWWAVDNIRVMGEKPSATPGKVLSVAIAADKVSLSWESFGTGSYRVQFTDNLSSAVWSDVPGSAWPTTETQWTGDNLSAVRSRWYRVVSE